MSNNSTKTKQDTFQKDFLASLVVFLVAVPLCLGIAIASGMSPTAGLISGLIGGLVVGTFSGCSLQVSGPAAGLVALVWEVIEKHGIEQLGIIVFAAGVLQIIFGYLKIGQWFRAVTPSVINGMLSGIGVLIFSSQFHVMVDDAPRSNGLQNLISIPSSLVKGALPMDGTSHHIAGLIGIITISIIIIWNFLPKKIKAVPAPIVAIVIASAISNINNLPIKYVSIPDNLFSDIHFLSPSSFSYLFDWEITISVIAFTFIASAETLLTATAVSQMRPELKTNYNKETIAQGIGNSIAGFLGVLPITGVIVRSAANVQAGAQTRLSTILHGVWILIFVLVFPSVLEKVPVCSLAAILVYTGYKLFNFKIIKELAKYGKVEVLIFFITIAGIVCISLLEGIIIGLVISFGRLIYNLAYIEISEIKDEENKSLNVYIKGNATFVNLPRVSESLEALPSDYRIHVHVAELGHIDHACIEFLANWEKSCVKDGKEVDIKWDELLSKSTKK